MNLSLSLQIKEKIMKIRIKRKILITAVIVFVVVSLVSGLQCLLRQKNILTIQNHARNVESYFDCGDNINNELNDPYSYEIENDSGLGCYTDNCGLGRENGYSETYFNEGCRNWQIMPAYSPFYKYYIDTDSMSGLSETDQETFVNNIRNAINSWNSVEMHDGSGHLVQLVETTPDANNSVGTNVCPIQYNPNLEDSNGKFTPIPLFYKIEIKNYSGERTIRHELGHLLGLQDLDRKHDVYDHAVLMGYKHFVPEIQYQDIQGVAVANNKHTQHDFRRYAYVDGQYTYVCFYCDIQCTESEHLSGSQPFVEAATCIHDFQPMVSAGERHWLKCTQCYKVIESMFYVRGIDINGISSLEITGLINSNETEIVIPEHLGNVNVVGLADNAFYGRTDLIEIEFEINSKLSWIGKSVFAGCKNIKNISLPIFSIRIDNKAFYGCSSLENITIPASTTYIGDGAFAGCSNLNIVMSTANPNYSAQDNILYSKDKTKIIATGQIHSIVEIPNTVTEIAPSAFEGNTNLQTLDFGKTTPTIGERAFADCNNLQKAYFYSYDVPACYSDSFFSDSFTAYVPYISQGDYAMMFEQNDVDVTFIQTVLSYISDGQVIYQEDVYYGSILHSMYLPQRNGCEFEGWYRDESLHGESVNDGILWEETEDTSLYANWNAVEYKIYFNLNGGTLSSANPLTYTVNDQIVFDEPTKLGNTFTGWTIDGQTVNGINEGTYGDIDVDANWQVNQYTISFDINGGAPQIEPITVTFGQSFSINIVPTKYGYYLDGWDYNGERYLDGQGGNLKHWDVAGNATLTAQWSVKEYYIRIGEDGNIWLDVKGVLTENPSPIQCGAGLDLINLIKKFKDSSAGFRVGKIFDHFEYCEQTINWTKIPDLGEHGTTVSIEPIWVLELHSIHFHMQVGSDPATIRANYGEKINLPRPNVDGYSFNYWSTDENGANRVNWTTMPDLTPNEQNNGSCDLYGHVVPIKYTITYKLDGGINSANNPTSYYITSELSLSNPTKKGYTFNGWYLDANKQTKFVAKTELWGDLTLYAKWTPNQYTVILDRQSGTGGATSVKATYDSKLKTVSAPTYKGYTFEGYYTQVNGKGTQYYDSQMNGVNNWVIDGNSTLYAYWKVKVYTITLHSDGNAPFDIYIEVEYNAPMPEVDRIAPSKTGYMFVGYFSERNGRGTQYYSMSKWNDGQTAAINGTDYCWAEGISNKYKVNKQDKYFIWDKDFDATLYAHYELYECDYDVKDIWYSHDALGSTTYHLIHGKTTTITANKYDGYTFKYFAVTNMLNDIPETTMNYYAELYRDSYFEIVPKGSIVAIYEKNECVAQGTLITLADGRQVPVESLKGDEILLVWNMLTGQYDASRILFIDKDPAQVYKVINLGFSDGTTVKVISEHGFWDYNLNKYVYLRQDASKYIGHWFNKGDTRVQLTSVDVRDEYTTAYSPVTYGHLCYYVNGMLSMPGGISGLFNIFEVDPDTMTINAEAMARDIAQYGLFTYEEFAEQLPVTEDVFNAFNAQYFKVAIGKGLISIEQLENLVNRYSTFWVDIQ